MVAALKIVGEIKYIYNQKKIEIEKIIKESYYPNAEIEDIKESVEMALKVKFSNQQYVILGEYYEQQRGNYFQTKDTTQ